MEEEKKDIFKSFTEKAIRRLQDKRIRKYRTLYIPSLDENIRIRSLDYPEVVECTELAGEEDSTAGDRYSVYLSVVEPDLKKVAQEMKDQGVIQEYMEVVNIFNRDEVTQIALEIMKLSDIIGDKKVHVVKELKNS